MLVLGRFISIEVYSVGSRPVASFLEAFKGLILPAPGKMVAQLRDESKGHSLLILIYLLFINNNILTNMLNVA